MKSNSNLSKPAPQKIALTHHGEVNRTFIIMAISLILIILAAVFFFTTGLLSGKAIEIPAPTLSFTLAVDNTFTITANYPGQIVNGFSFQLTSNTVNFDVCTPANLQQLDTVFNDGFVQTECLTTTSGNVINYGDAAITPSLFQSSSISLTFPLPQTIPGPLSLRLRVNAYETASGNNLYGQEIDYNFVRGVAQPIVSVSAVSGGGGGGGGGGGSSLSCGRKWSCSGWTTCTNGKQTRTCEDLNKCQTEKTVGGITFPVTVVGPVKPVTEQTCKGGITTTEISVKTVEEQQLSSLQNLPKKGIIEEPSPLLSQPQATSTESRWSIHGIYLWLGFLGLLLLALAVILVLHAFRKKAVLYNYPELKNWVDKEKKKGISEDEILKHLSDKTNWKKEEVKSVILEKAVSKK
ncbi:hypothetical protein HYU21_04490 [Candidatus Woesearchaeota archaeon]|nr:hypothetical protein [Candidatus Woesearchaeota archaeon]